MDLPPSVLSAKAVRTTGESVISSLRVAAPALLLVLLPLAGCNGGSGHGGGVGSTLRISLDFASAAPTTPAAAWIDGPASAGEMQTVDILARDLSTPYDAFALEISFNTAFVEVLTVQSGGALATCSMLTPVLITNLSASPSPNTSGTLLISEALPGSPPPGCVISGTDRLASIVFRAKNSGDAQISLQPCTGADASTATGSCFYRRGLVSGIPVTSLVVVNAGNLRGATLSVSGS